MHTSPRPHAHLSTSTDEEEEGDGPITERERPYRKALALLSDGRVALSVSYVEGADLSGYERWEGIILEPDQAEHALDSMVDAAALGSRQGGSSRPSARRCAAP